MTMTLETTGFDFDNITSRIPRWHDGPHALLQDKHGNLCLECVAKRFHPRFGATCGIYEPDMNDYLRLATPEERKFIYLANANTDDPTTQWTAVLPAGSLPMGTRTTGPKGSWWSVTKLDAELALEQLAEHDEDHPGTHVVDGFDPPKPAQNAPPRLVHSAMQQAWQQAEEQRVVGRATVQHEEEPAPESPQSGDPSVKAAYPTGAKQRQAWDMLDALYDEMGRSPRCSEARNRAPEFGINPSTATVQLGKWRKHWDLAAPEPAWHRNGPYPPEREEHPEEEHPRYEPEPEPEQDWKALVPARKPLPEAPMPGASFQQQWLLAREAMDLPAHLYNPMLETLVKRVRKGTGVRIEKAADGTLSIVGYRVED